MKNLGIGLLILILVGVIGILFLMTWLIQLVLGQIFDTDLSSKFWWIFLFVLLIRFRFHFNVNNK